MVAVVLVRGGLFVTICVCDGPGQVGDWQDCAMGTLVGGI